MIQFYRPRFDYTAFTHILHNLNVLQKTERMLFHVFQEVEYYTDH
jgi:hypothetical protein